MPLVTKLIRIGDATGVILDPANLQQADIERDSEVEVSVENNSIVIRPDRYANDDNARGG